MKKLLSFFAVLFAVLILSSNSFAQQWTSEQKEVWQTEIKCWDALQSGNVDMFMKFFDDSYMDWDFQNTAPQNKTDVTKGLRDFLQNNSFAYYTLTPVTIWVNGDYAYAQYFYTIVTKNKQTGKENHGEGNWTDILLKKGGNWLLVGDRGGRTSKPGTD